MEVNPDRRSGSGRRATLKQVAAEVGVSLATVSNAYNRPDQLSVELRERVFEAAERLGYAGPDAMARGLRRRRAGAIGVLYEDRLSYAFADPAAVLFLQGVSMSTEDAGLGLLLLSGAPGTERDPEAVRGAVVDGFVVYSMSDGDPLVEAALERRLPSVVVDQPRVSRLPFISIEDQSSARSVAEHLVSLGHRRFGVVSFAGSPDLFNGIVDITRQEAAAYEVTRARLLGYRSAFEAAGIRWEDVPVYEHHESTTEAGRTAVKALLERDPHLTAILCLSDQLALGVLEALKSAGLSVPEDVSVAGFDDVPEASRSTPPLTTVHQPHVEKGLLAGRMLVAGIGGEESNRSESLPTHLVVRGSTTAPASRA